MSFEGIIVKDVDLMLVEKWRKKVNEAVDNRQCIICGKKHDGVRMWSCSDSCHEKLVELFEEDMGRYKDIADAETGKKYRVPLRHIIEHGLQYNELKDFPVVEK